MAIDRDRTREPRKLVQEQSATVGDGAPSTAEHASMMGNHAFGQTLAAIGGTQVAREVAAPAPAAAKPTLSRRVLARRGTPIPSGAVPVPTATNSVDGTAVTNKLTAMGSGMWSGFDGFQGTPVERQIINAFETSNLQPRSIAINWTDERGLNKLWTGTVNIRQEGARAVGSPGTGKMTGSGGGSGTSGTSTSTSNTSGASAEAGAGVGGHEGAASASGKVGGSTSTTTTQGEAVGASGSGGTGSETQDRLQRYECTIVADIFLRMEMDISGTDYFNPFKWGMYGAEAASGPLQRSDSVTCGTWTYQLSTGFNPAPPPAGG